MSNFMELRDPSEDVKPEHAFMLRDGKTISNLKSLHSALQQMDEDVFRHHVCEGKNDFSNWVRDIHADHDLAEKLLGASEIDSCKRLLGEHIAEFYEVEPSETSGAVIVKPSDESCDSENSSECQPEKKQNAKGPILMDPAMIPVKNARREMKVPAAKTETLISTPTRPVKKRNMIPLPENKKDDLSEFKKEEKIAQDLINDAKEKMIKMNSDVVTKKDDQKMKKFHKEETIAQAILQGNVNGAMRMVKENKKAAGKTPKIRPDALKKTETAKERFDKILSNAVKRKKMFKRKDHIFDDDEKKIKPDLPGNKDLEKSIIIKEKEIRDDVPSLPEKEKTFVKTDLDGTDAAYVIEPPEEDSCHELMQIIESKGMAEQIATKVSSAVSNSMEKVSAGIKGMLEKRHPADNIPGTGVFEKEKDAFTSDMGKEDILSHLKEVFK